MLPIVRILPVLLFCLAPAAATVAAESQSQAVRAPGSDMWRRTTRGWERADVWLSPRVPPRTAMWAVHPLVVALLMLLTSLAAHCFFPRSRVAGRRRR